ncbi:MAG: hypothetical protein PHH69_03665 [Candidatus Omnitrophica bacterium]|nr:hypothetical protein [Candidatus Omnitrophota bacterium]
MKLKRYTKLIAFRASPELKEKVDETSFRLNMTEGELIREAVGKYLKERVKGLEAQI